MESSNKKYWKGVEDYKNDIELIKNADREFNLDDVEGGTHRRDFLKMLGFGMAAVTLAACEAPVRKAIPYVNKPIGIEPGIPNYYASSYTLGGDYSSILVKTVEGRPIKIEGNESSPINKGKANARVQASVLGLYDNNKLTHPTAKEGRKVDWKTIDAEIQSKLNEGGNIRIVSNTILSPTLKSIINDFKSKYANTDLVVYDGNSSSAILEANANSFGKSIIPNYRFDNADVIVGVNCDFLGTWISPIEFASQWAKTRKVSSGKNGKKTMSRHYQFETGMTITGASADYRGMIKPSEELAFLVALYNGVSGNSYSVPAVNTTYLNKCIKDLKNANGKALVVCGTNDVASQTLVNAINSSLSSFGNTIDLGTSINTRQGLDSSMNKFIDELKSGSVKTVIFLNSNPVYDHVRGQEIATLLKKVPNKISTAERVDETAKLCDFIAPSSHYLESWGDAEPKSGQYSLMQPTITRIFNTRQAEDSLLQWAGLGVDMHRYLQDYWEKNILKGGSWVSALENGVYGSANNELSGGKFSGDVASAVAKANQIKNEGIELAVFENIAIGTGLQANNPWLQELPDPISKVTWENTLALSLKTANELGLAQGDIAELTANGKKIELPVLIQPGQAHGTVSVAMGYGRTDAGKAGNVGQDVLPLLGGKNTYWQPNVKLRKTNDGYRLAQTQTHETIMGRHSVVQESILANYINNDKAGRFEPKIETSEGPKDPTQITLWNGHSKFDHSWGMVIDLNTCTGCAACLVSCQAENNVAVVGKKEVARAREMHWIRLDRYYSSDAGNEYVMNPEKLREMEVAAENPEVVMQPMMCQHCSNAPCETVCPVLATTHSSEGLNQMTYNRCVGTRYCANNCPYKVRRFNWFKYFENDNFDYHMNNELGRMVLNPEVTVRSRGVIEKCSMCVQRIQAGKLEAKREKRRPVDGEIVTACAQTCPTGAITFGDMMDPESKISKLLAQEKEGRAYHILEEINVQPQLSYLTKIRNKDARAEVQTENQHS